MSSQKFQKNGKHLRDFPDGMKKPLMLSITRRFLSDSLTPVSQHITLNTNLLLTELMPPPQHTLLTCTYEYAFCFFLTMQKLQDMEEKRIERLGVCMKTYADVDRQVLPIVGKCLDGMTKAAESIEPKAVSTQVETCARASIWDALVIWPKCQLRPTRCWLGFSFWQHGCQKVGTLAWGGSGKGLLENKNCAAQRGWSCKLKDSK